MPSLPYWLFPGDARPPAEIDDEVAEELRLHLDLLAEERMRQGVTPDQAKQQAAERFGDYDTLLRRCRLEKQGDIPMLKRIQAMLTLLLLLVVVWLGVRDYMTAETTAQYMTQTTTFLKTIQSDLAEMRGELKYAEGASQTDDNRSNFTRGQAPNKSASDSPPADFYRAAPSPPTPPASIDEHFADLRIAPPEQVTRTVLVRGTNGDPISQATAHGIYATRSGDSVLSGLPLGKDGRAIWNTTAHAFVIDAPGYARVTHSFGEDRAGYHAVTLELDKAVPFELRVTKADGTPAKFMSVVPVRRTDLEDNSHDFPPETRDLWCRTDAEGRVTADWLIAGDLATILLKERGKPIESATTVEFEVPRDASKVVTIILQEGRGEFGGGRSGGEFGGGFGSSKTYEVKIGDEADEPAEKPSRQRRRGGGGRGGDFGGGGYGGGGFGGNLGGQFDGTASEDTATTEKTEAAESPENE